MKITCIAYINSHLSQWTSNKNIGNRQEQQKFTKYICTCEDEQHGPKTEQQFNKELNHHLRQSSFPKILDIKLSHLHESSTTLLTCDIQNLIDKLTNNSINKLVWSWVGVGARKSRLNRKPSKSRHPKYARNSEINNFDQKLKINN